MGLREDVAGMLDDLGVPVVLGANSTKGILREHDDNLLPSIGTSFVGRVRSLLLLTDSLEGLAEGATLTVDRESYRVVSALREGHGITTRVTIAKV